MDTRTRARRDSANVETLRAAIEAFNRREGGRFDALLAEDAQIVPARAALEGTVYRGPDAASQYCAAVDGIWEGMTFESEDITDHGDCAVALGRMRGRARTSGAMIDVTAGWVAHFRDGLVTSFHTHADRAKALEAVGTRPA
jgi:ketosteroid isomerase-like protein